MKEPEADKTETERLKLGQAGLSGGATEGGILVDIYIYIQPKSFKTERKESTTSTTRIPGYLKVEMKMTGRGPSRPIQRLGSPKGGEEESSQLRIRGMPRQTVCHGGLETRSKAKRGVFFSQPE